MISTVAQFFGMRSPLHHSIKIIPYVLSNIDLSPFSLQYSFTIEKNYYLY
ncbi:hypothetical protein FDUTEX481_09965 [Tolypothrix sp. PCC 7601]|nr:hypothetical protein FDUTEX481_09965 [Tolypothrix sp. PCC 7601]